MENKNDYAGSNKLKPYKSSFSPFHFRAVLNSEVVILIIMIIITRYLCYSEISATSYKADRQNQKHRKVCVRVHIFKTNAPPLLKLCLGLDHVYPKGSSCVKSSGNLRQHGTVSFPE